MPKMSIKSLLHTISSLKGELKKSLDENRVLRDEIDRNIKTINNQHADVDSLHDRLRIANSTANFNSRAQKLSLKGVPFIVIAVDEDYFPEAYRLIRNSERAHGRWGVVDEDAMQTLMLRWLNRQR